MWGMKKTNTIVVVKKKRQNKTKTKQNKTKQNKQTKKKQDVSKLQCQMAMDINHCAA